ncbi:hypothetical protein [Aeromonas salmonicida]|jgi:hypothetical protein|uniref:hypothetical protein n=1 Tax=Aeromonas salmonicida TaxID=645 RepID=UPI00240E893B|nr:hypothetical protein [Aeromonas salmonicida]WFC12675.1 hypothetical protein L3V47_13045 [Aeromonas salmonicida]
MKLRVIAVSCLLLITLLSGCGLAGNQIVETKSFGMATENIGKLGEEEFVNIRNGIIEMNKELVSIDNKKMADSLVFDKPTYADPTSKRVAASKALKLYGELLTKLVSEDRSENLQKAASSLIDNTSAALGQELPDETTGAINKIIVGFGSFWVEKKKADAAKEIILAYQKPVADLADLLSKDFSVENNALGYLKAYETTAKRLKNASMVLINAGGKYTVLERERAVHAFVMSEMAITRSNELSNKAKKSIDGLKKANIELVKMMNNQQYNANDIKSYAKQIQDLVNVYQVLSK